MMPPGRRKGLPSLLYCVFVLLVSSTVVNAAAAALGIDFGTEYIKAAVAKPGSPIEIVLTKDSKRKEAAALAFKPSRAQANDQDAYPERLYGGDALAVAARFPGDVYLNLKTLLGLPHQDRSRAQFNERFPSLQLQPMTRENGGNSMGFASKNLGEPEPFMVEELVAMQLQNIKSNAEAAVGKNNFVSDAVITYPAFYTADEKKALELAAELAGFRLLGLISDGHAVGLNYATSRTLDTKKTMDPEHYVVYDMGAGSTTATVFKFAAKTIKGPGKKNVTVPEVQVLGTGYDRHMGGDLLNNLIIQDMIAKFVDTPQAKAQGIQASQVKKDGKSMARIWRDAEKLRQVLSANQQASASFESLAHEDVSFKYSLTRAEYEKLAQPIALRIAAPLSSALLMADIDMASIHSIILHGGLTRTPFVQAELEKAAGSASKVKTNINADEAAAFGAAFRAATLSASFRVKDIRSTDIAGSSYTMKWTTDGKDRQQKIFLETSQVGAEKSVTIRSTNDVVIEFSQTTPFQEASQPILTVEAKNLTKSAAELRNSYGCADQNITTTFVVRLSPFDGLPEIISGSVSCEAQKAKEGSVMDNVKGMFGFGSKKEGQVLLTASDEGIDDLLHETPLPVDDPTSSGSIVSEATATSLASSADSEKTKARPSTVAVPLSCETTYVGAAAPPRKALPIIKQRLTAFDTSDRNAQLRSEALNVLEAYTYRARDYLEDEAFETFSTDVARKNLRDLLTTTSDWLYGEGTDAKLQEFKDRLKQLKALVEPVLKRKEENSKRDQAVETLRNSLSNASSMLEMIKSNIEKAAEVASSSAQSAGSSVSASAPSVIAHPDGVDDLEDEPYSNAANAAPSETEVVMPKPYEYTQDDLSSIEKVYNSASEWLESKLAAQQKLSPHDDPALLVADVDTRAKQLGAAVSDVIMKQIRVPPKSKKSKSSKKSKATKSSSASAASSTVEPSQTAKSSTKDEL